jgi:tRNA-dihydrouridine synthase A
MITTSAILRGGAQRHLHFNKEEHPVVLQLGGSDRNELIKSCEFAEKFKYDEVNLNVGCPSDRVQKGRFGACLMNEPELVVDCVEAMQKAVDIPITIKCRIGVDDNDSYENFSGFVTKLFESGVSTVIVHARKAWLKGLSPKQNRSVPPLNYDFVYRIKQQLPDLTVVINGGIESVEQVNQHLDQVDGVMLGRAVWTQPWLLYELQKALVDSEFSTTRDDVLKKYIEYSQCQIDLGAKIQWLLPPILGLYHGLAGNKKWKSHLVTQASNRMDDVTIFNEARDFIQL